jgi:hypothetical protein
MKAYGKIGNLDIELASSIEPLASLELRPKSLVRPA